MKNKQYFLSYFVQNNRKSKFSIFDLNHPLTPLKNSNIAAMLKSRRAYFLTRWSSNIFSKPILFKEQKVRFSIFDESHVIVTLTTFSIATTWNPYLYSPGGRLLTWWSSDIISRLIVTKNIDEICSFWRKPWVSPFEKNTVSWLCKIYIFIV